MKMITCLRSGEFRIFAALLALIAALFAQTSSANVTQAPRCALASEGIYNGSWVKHRIFVQEDVVFGANDLNSILSQLETLRDQGLCR